MGQYCYTFLTLLLEVLRMNKKESVAYGQIALEAMLHITYSLS